MCAAFSVSPAATTMAAGEFQTKNSNNRMGPDVLVDTRARAGSRKVSLIQIANRPECRLAIRPDWRQREEEEEEAPTAASAEEEEEFQPTASGRSKKQHDDCA